MKHLCPFWLCLSLFSVLNASPVQATDFWAKNYIVMESLTHQVLEGKAESMKYKVSQAFEDHDGHRCNRAGRFG